MDWKYRDEKSKKLERQKRENEGKQRITRAQKRNLLFASDQTEDDYFLPGLDKWDNEITRTEKTNTGFRFSPNIFDFTPQEKSDSQDSVLLQLEKNCALLDAIDLNIEPRFSEFEADSDTESKKSLSLLHHFELINSSECHSNNYRDSRIGIKYERNSDYDFVSERMHRAVQTECSVLKQQTDRGLREDPAFLEALIYLKNLSNAKSEETRFHDILTNYSFRFGSDVSVNLESSYKIQDNDKGFEKFLNKDSETLNFCRESKTKRKKKIRERRPQRHSLRSRKDQFLLSDGIIGTVEDQSDSQNSFDFTPVLSEDLNFFGGYQSDSSSSEDSFASSKCHLRETFAIQMVNDAIIFRKVLETFLDFTTNIVMKNMADLGRTWKNSSIEDGMKIINRMVGYSMSQIDIQEIFFHFLKKIFDSFFDEASCNMNRDLEYRAILLTVICDSPYFYLDLINYSIERLNFMKQYHEFLTMENRIQLLGGNGFTCRVLKRLLEKFYSDLKKNLDFMRTDSVTVLNLWEKRWKFSRFEHLKTCGSFRDFKIMVHGWYASLSDFLSFCLDNCCVMALIILECKSLVRNISAVIS